MVCAGILESMGMIGLMDCNNFFVSCERLFRPDLQGRPVAVLSSNDGCIVARSQEVKDLGIAMGVPYFQVKDICKKENVTLFSGNLTLYRDISTRVMDVLHQEVGKCEIYSIDEAFFTVSAGEALEYAQSIRNIVMKKVGIPVSVGFASTKTLAKQASSLGKKEGGYYVLGDTQWKEHASLVRCGEIWGLGRQTSTKLSQMGIKTVADFMSLSHAEIRQNFGVGTERVYSELHGKKVFSVGGSSESVRQSIMSTRSFAQTTTSCADLESAVAQHVTSVAEKLRQRNLLASRMNVQIQTNRFGDFFMQGDSAEVVFPEPTAQTAVLLKFALGKVRSMFLEGVPYKKSGVSMSGLVPESYVTQDMFTVHIEKTASKLDEVTDAINEKFGRGALRSAAILDRGAKTNVQLRSPHYTTDWKDIPKVRT